MNLFLQLKVIDENNSKIESINLSSLKVAFLVVAIFKLKFGRMIMSLIMHVTQFTIWQKYQYSSRYGIPNFVVLLIDSILRVSA